MNRIWIHRIAPLRLIFWLLFFSLIVISRTLFIVQTFSQSFILISFWNFLLTLISMRRRIEKVSMIFDIVLVLSTCVTTVIYSFDMWTISYRITNLVTLNLMTNDHEENWLAQTLVHYRCCRIHRDFLFDSENERDYFLQFDFCQNQTSNFPSCVFLFDFLQQSIRLFCLIDLFLWIVFCIVFISNRLIRHDVFIPMSRSTKRQ